MLAMPRPRWPHLQKQITRHGKTVWYVRRGHGARVRLQSAYGTPEFEAEYLRAVIAKPPPERPKVPQKSAKGSLAWLWDRYRETTAWTEKLSRATRRQRENIMLHVLAACGDDPFEAVTTMELVKGRDRRTATQGRNFLDAMRGLFRWALAAGHVEVDPTDGAENPPRKDGVGFPAWTEEDVARYEFRWPLGTPQRVWLAVLLCTGLRRGDAVKLGKQHYRANGRGMIRTEKTGVEVPLIMTEELAAAIATGPTGDLAFICGLKREPMTKESFGNAFSEACRAAGVKKSAHGVRKLAATRLADAGATVHELEAVFGWHGGTMAALYTKDANRRRLVESAMQKRVRNSLIESDHAQITDTKTRSG